ncbi:MAG: Entericidin rane lipoprotein [Betaproteobacteria bacterium]|jgi:predicted small secreted protein|nr:Entericidin rane lipoprotein [Betaproteobacteria bacterium]
MFKKLIAQAVATAFVAGLIGALGGCNTMEGAGKDVERGGSKLKNEAQEKKAQ